MLDHVRASAGRPLKVALVTTFYPPCNFGGDGQYVRRFAHALARRGCEVEVIHDADAWTVLSGHPKGEPLPAVLPEPPGVTVRRLQSGWPMGSTLLTQQFGSPVVQKKAIEALLGAGFDVIHYHNVSLVGGPGVLALGEGIKLYTPHEHWLVCPSHVLWRHNRELCTGRECLKCAITFKRPPQLWRATGHLDRQAKHVDAFIALSKSVANNHKAFGFDREMTLLASFLPDAEAPGAEPAPPAPAERPYFLFVGRLEVIKGLQDVIPAFDDSIPADLVIAGAGAYEPELRRLANGSPQIKFIGHTAPSDLVGLYRGSRGLIASSLCYEVFPMVALEAFREGTPIIARDLGPYPQIVEESQAGLLFQDKDSLQAALRRLATDPDLRERLGASGRAALKSRWSEATAMTAYFDLIKRIAAARSKTDVVQKIDLLAGALAE